MIINSGRPGIPAIIYISPSYLGRCPSQAVPYYPAGKGVCHTPHSVTHPSINSAGVISKAGFQTLHRPRSFERQRINVVHRRTFLNRNVFAGGATSIQRREGHRHVEGYPMVTSQHGQLIATNLVGRISIGCHTARSQNPLCPKPSMPQPCHHHQCVYSVGCTFCNGQTGTLEIRSSLQRIDMQGLTLFQCTPNHSKSVPCPPVANVPVLQMVNTPCPNSGAPCEPNARLLASPPDEWLDQKPPVHLAMERRSKAQRRFTAVGLAQ